MALQPTRRKLITGLIAFATAPAIVRIENLMPVKVMKPAFQLDVENITWTVREGDRVVVFVDNMGGWHFLGANRGDDMERLLRGDTAFRSDPGCIPIRSGEDLSLVYQQPETPVPQAG